MREARYVRLLTALHARASGVDDVLSDPVTGRVLCRAEAGGAPVLCVADRDGDLAGMIRSYYLETASTAFRPPLRYRINAVNELPPPSEQTGGDLMTRVPATTGLTVDDAAELTAMLARSTPR